MTNFSTLETHLDARGVLWISLTRLDVRNAFNEVMISELTTVFKENALDPKVKICVLLGKGPTFCAGGDLNWMKKSVTFTRQENLKDTTILVELFRLMNEMPKPLLAGVQGAAIGGGVGLVSVCDFVCASQETQFGLSEVRLGLIPACIGPFVIAKIGASFARALFLSGERFEAKRAYEIGLVHRLVASPQDLVPTLEKMIENLLQCAPGAMAAAKKLILELSWPEKRASQSDCLYYAAEMLADLRVSPEGQEGVKAFLDKRKPNWIKS
jgi:methylglutaconyl-CoA hydratase